MRAYRVTRCTTIGETLFTMAFGVEDVIPIEMGLPSHWVKNYDDENNIEQMMIKLDLVEKGENKPLSGPPLAIKYYNKKFCPRTFNVRDLVLKKVLV